MQVKMKDFQNHFETIKREMLKSNITSIQVRKGVEYSACSGVPIVVVYALMSEMGIDSERLEKRIDEILKERGETLLR
jgi:hypothetical protein